MSEEEVEVGVRAVNVEATAQLTEMGIRITVRCRTVICTYDFEADEDPEVLMALIGISPKVVVHQMHELIQSLEDEKKT